MLTRFFKLPANETHEEYKQLLFYLRNASIQFYDLPSWECYKVSEIKDLVLDLLNLKCCEADRLSSGALCLRRKIWAGYIDVSFNSMGMTMSQAGNINNSLTGWALTL